MEDGGVFKIKEIQAAKRRRFSAAHFSARDFLSAFPFYLTRQKVTAMFPEEFLKLLQVAILVQAPAKFPSLFLSQRVKNSCKESHCRIKTSRSSFGSNGGVGLEQLR